MKKLKKGFSFIELIVVITIIAILSVAGMISYGSVSMKSRDSRRISDLEKMRMALEMARQLGTTYPATATALVPTYLEKIPADPKNVNYFYTQLSGGYKYTIWAKVEDPSLATGSYGGGSYNYQVSNP